MDFIERFIRLPDLLTRWDCPLEYVCSKTQDGTPPALRCYKIHSVRKSGGCFTERQMPFIARHEFDRVELRPYPGSERTRIKEPLYLAEDIVFDLDEIERLEGRGTAEDAMPDATAETQEKDAQAGADEPETPLRSFWQYVLSCERSGMDDARIAVELKRSGFSEPAIAMLLHNGELTKSAVEKAFQRLKQRRPDLFQK